VRKRKHEPDIRERNDGDGEPRDDADTEKPGDAVAPGRTGAARADSDWEPAPDSRRGDV
jgi:hypothetical protein